ncbi:putative disease resistance protein RGA1 [Bienertia sinuspersici]
MDIVGTSLSAAQTLLAALQCPQLKDIPEIIGYESQLDDLKRTVKTVTAVLRDAERKIELSEQTQILIEELKDVVFEADDLLDEFVTLAVQKRILKVEGRVSEKVRSFFSSSNQLGVAYRMSRGVNKIKKKLDAIAYNKQFNFDHNPAPIRFRSRETYSYVNEVDIIGRDDDLERIVGTLLNESNVRHDVFFLSIVGIGGSGKTALAQLVFNDQRVTSAFSLRMWTCVADQDQKQLDVKGILRMILASVDNNLNLDSTLDQIQSQLLHKLAGRKYLLVLDDVWTENRTQWGELVKYLNGGETGSWILVTTRSQKTAIVVDDQPNPPDDLVNIGHEIVNRCAQVPLAIRVAGSLVYGQEKSKWQSVQNIGIANIRDDDNDIMPILKLSFHHLDSPLKSCFSYCALFPKDFKIEKKMSISLWMAQGYIVPLDYGQSIGDATEEYFSILLKRCFFQDVEENVLGEVESCKIHDLMHDIAQSVSRKEIYTLNTTNNGNVSNIKIRHLSIVGTREYGKYPSDFKTLNNLKGELKIKIRWPEKAKNNKGCKEESWSWREGLNLCLRSMEHLHRIELDFKEHKDYEENIMRLMEELQPHPNLKKLQVIGYDAGKMPGWITPTSLPRLEILCLYYCQKLEYLPLFPSLKTFVLDDVPNLKQLVVEESSSDSSIDSNPHLQQSLPCLHQLSIKRVLRADMYSALSGVDIPIFILLGCLP